MKKEEILYYKRPFEIISNINAAKWGLLSKKLSPLDGTKAYYRITGKRISLSFQIKNYTHPTKLDIGQTFKKVEFKSKTQDIICEDFYFLSHSPPLAFVAGCDFFYSKGFSKKSTCYYKLLIPLKKKHEINREIGRDFFKSDGHYIKESTRAVINLDTIIVNIIKDDKLGYFLSIESKTKQSFESFSEKAHAVKNGLGYLTGYLAGNKGYYFIYTNKKMVIPKHFYVCALRNEIISNYTPIHSNPYGYIRHKRKLAEKYYKDPTLREVSIPEFSTLCQRLHDSITFSTALLLILEASVATLLFMPGGYAIALETLSDIVINKKKLNLAPIKDSSINAKIIKECKNILMKYSSSLAPDELKVLTSRIENINQITNRARLRAPFDILGIKLLQADIAILDTRNDFLHGRAPDLAKDGSIRSTSRINKELYYASIRLYTLLNILILNWIGFDGRVVNYPKINENYTKIKLKEDYFRKV